MSLRLSCLVSVGVGLLCLIFFLLCRVFFFVFILFVLFCFLFCFVLFCFVLFCFVLFLSRAVYLQALLAFQPTLPFFFVLCCLMLRFFMEINKVEVEVEVILLQHLNMKVSILLLSIPLTLHASHPYKGTNLRSALKSLIWFGGRVCLRSISPLAS